MGDLLSLFRNGEDGFLFGPFDTFERMFLLSFGNSGNVAANNDPVGLNLDRHSWSGASVTAILAAQPELVSNGDFTSGTTGWTGVSATLTNPAGRLSIALSGAGGRAVLALTTVVGKSYQVTADLISSDDTAAAPTISNNSDGSSAYTPAPASVTLGTNKLIFVATATTSYLCLRGGTSGRTNVWDNVSCKLVPGNHAPQATTTKRPLYKTNSGKPYLLFDGTDDTLISPFLPTATLTLAAAFNGTTASKQVLGGGDTASNRRAFLGLDANGKICGGFGVNSSNTIFGGSDIRNADSVGLLTADATSVDLWLNGALVYTGAPNGSPATATAGVGMGSFNNSGFWAGNIFAAIALNRKVTAGEIAMITNQFRSTYQ